MSWLQRAVDIHGRLGAEHSDADDLLKRLPSALGRMGLVRCLEWLAVGKHAATGQSLMGHIAPPLLLHPTVSASVEQLETCDRRAFFRHQRDARRLFDALATVSRMEST